MRKLAYLVVLSASALILSSCADQFPVAQSSYVIPADKSDYIGEWRSESITLIFSKDGNVSYEQRKGPANSTISGPIKTFVGDNFEIGIGPIATTFVVTAAPHQLNNAWKMTVDGNELTKQL